MSRTIVEVHKYYSDRLKAFTDQVELTKTKIRKLSILRISVFLITIIGIYFATTIGWVVVVATSVIGLGLFIWLVIKHARLFKKRQWLETLADINRSEIDLLSGKTASKPDGMEYAVPDHPFTDDLDIFGRNSLFQLIDRSATRQGREKLAHILNLPLQDENQLIQRQEAIGELKNKADWRQKFQATGKLSGEEDQAISELKQWAGSDQGLFNKAVYKLLIVLTPLIGFGIITLITFDILGFGAFLFFLFLPFFIIGPKISTLNHEHANLSKKGSLLEKYSDLFGQIDTESFSSNILIDTKEQLSSGKSSAKNAVQELSKISAAFDYRLNFLVGIFLNIFFLWDIIQCIRIERWKNDHSDQLVTWFDTLARVDELSSLAGFAFNYPDSVFPELSKQFKIEASDVKHPFINQKESIGNKITIPGWQHFQIITGANMAGKSTYLRAVGINLILAMTGAPVLAKNFTFKPVQLFTGIKTSDSLQDGESYFFAELKRLKSIIDMIESGQQVFIILDEILRGTNSADKQKGSKALISQLIKFGASGMIATHDLTLGELVKSFPDNAVNKRFEVEIKNDELVFDYKLKDGISQNLNASFLMEKMGITLE